MLMFVGCSNTIDLSEHETDMFAEYISKEVLAYNKNYTQELLEPVIEEDKKDEGNIHTTILSTDKDLVETDSISLDAEKYVAADLNEVLGTKSIEVSYKSSHVYDSYPSKGEGYFVINSMKGYDLIVISFELKNVTKINKVYNMLQEDVNYTLTTKNGNTYSPLLTLLMDDLQFIDKEIPGKDTDSAALVFRVPESEAKSKATLQIVNNQLSTTIEINK